jgi:hypothetical protein
MLDRLSNWLNKPLPIWAFLMLLYVCYLVIKECSKATMGLDSRITDLENDVERVETEVESMDKSSESWNDNLEPYE